MSLFLALLLACSDPVYYPHIDQPYPGSSGFQADDTGASDDTDWEGLSAVPCAPAALGPRWVYTVDNQHQDGTVLAWERHADCSLTQLGELGPGVVQGLAEEGRVFVYTDQPPTRVLAWLQVLANDAASVVVP